MSEGTAGLTNVTISGNSAAGVGGGILLRDGAAAGSPILDTTNVTIANNSAPTGSGIEFASGTLRLKNTIVANNTGPVPTASHRRRRSSRLGTTSIVARRVVSPTRPTRTTSIRSSGRSPTIVAPPRRWRCCPAARRLSRQPGRLPGHRSARHRPPAGRRRQPASLLRHRGLRGSAQHDPATDHVRTEAAGSVTSVPDGAGGLRVTVSTSGSGGALSALHFGAATNAQITAPGGLPNATGASTWHRREAPRASLSPSAVRRTGRQFRCRSRPWTLAAPGPPLRWWPRRLLTIRDFRHRACVPCSPLAPVGRRRSRGAPW